MTSLKHTLAVAPAVLVVLATVACPNTGGQGPIVDVPGFATCEKSEQCPTGHVCSAGGCVLGTCDPLLENACDVDGLESAYCCKPWELCSTLSFTCDNDPEVRGIGCAPDDESCTPCEEQDDCAAGQFCSGAACFDATGRTGCTSSFQCPSGERCDRNVFLCVPDRGGCTFCGPDFPELCCEDGEVCSEQTGFCQELPEAECDPQGANTCAPGLFCDDLGRCVQCVEDGDCGPNLACDEGQGTCFPPASICESDADCLGNKRCALSQRLCVLPECEDDAGCRADDSRTRCDLGQFQCFLPAAVCTEADEENDTPDSATPLVNGTSYSGELCRGDSDFLSFPVQANKRYTATVDFGGSGQPGISVVMLDTSRIVESSATFAANQAAVQVAGVTGESESGTFFLKVTGNNVDEDEWAYGVTIREDEPSQPADCTEAGQPEEPNDDFAQATDLVLGQTRLFSRCGTADADFYRVQVSPLHGVNVVLGGFFNAEGNINVELFAAPDAARRVDQGNSINDVETVDGPEGPTEYFLKVQLGSAAGALADQTYTITATEVARPAACDADLNEDDGSIASAAQLTLAPAPGDGNLVARLDGVIRCNPQDADHFRFAMPPNLGGVVMLRFTHSEGDMALDLLDLDGAVITSSNVSNAASDPDEQVTIPGNATDTIEYIARARLAGTSGGTIGQHYTIEVQTFDNAQCIASEPPGGDDTFADGRCLGAAANYVGSAFPCDSFTPEPLTPTCAAAPAGTPGCGRTCGDDDSDFYRVGILKNQQVIRAVLDYDPRDGAIDLVRSSAAVGATTLTETTIANSDGDGHVELAFVETSTTGRDHAVRVKPKGVLGHQLQPYSLQVEVGPECTDDDNDVGAATNEKPATATIIDRGAFTPATGPRSQTVTATRCNNDVDVYELIVLDGEDVIVELDQTDPSPGGLQAELGRRPADLNQLPVASTTAVAGGSPQTFTSTSDQTVYIVVRPGTGAVVTGEYTLRLRLE